MITSTADLTAFLKQFHRHWLANPSLPASQIPSDLPDALTSIYREFGALVAMKGDITPFGAQDCLYPLEGLKRVGGMVEFACENQGNWTCRCPLGSGDPPVYSDAPDIWNEQREGFVVICNSLSSFLTTLCLQEAIMSCRSLIAVKGDQPAQTALNIPLQPFWLNAPYVEEEPLRHFYTSSDRNVLVMEFDGAWVGSPEQKASDLVSKGFRIQVLR